MATVTALFMLLLMTDVEACVRISPSDPCGYETQTISMNCSSEFDPHDLKIFVGATKETYNETRILDGHTLGIVIANVTMAMNRANIVCFRDNGCFSYQLLRVFELPEETVRLACVVTGWDASMNCTWHLRKQYAVPPNVTLKWKRSACNAVDCWMNCPNYNGNSCIWSSTEDGNFSMRPLDITVTLGPSIQRQCLNKITTTHYKIDTATVVQPGPVDNLESRAVNCTSLQLSWKPKRTEYKKLYRVSCVSKWNNTYVIMMEDPEDEPMDTLILFNLVPYTKYTCTLQVKPASQFWTQEGSGGTQSLCKNCTDSDKCVCLNQEGFWSEARETSAITYSTVPSRAPVMMAGNYMWNPSECSHLYGYRSIYIFWQELDDRYKNGLILGYDIIYRSEEHNERRSVSSYNTFDMRNLSCDTEYRVVLVARNINGTSPAVSLTILPLNKGITPPNFIVEMSNTKDVEGKRQVVVSGPSTSDQWNNVTGYTVYICSNDGGDCDVRKPIKWLSVTGGAFPFSFNMTDPELYVYGLSMETIAGSSGFQWQACIYTKDTDPSETPSHLKVQAVEGDSSLIVTWNRLTCGQGRPFIVKYIVRYCTVGKKLDTCKDKEVSADQGSVSLQQLDEEQAYSVQVSAVTNSGRMGAWSNIQKATTNKALQHSEWEVTIGVSIPSAVLVITGIAAGAVCLRRWYKKKKETFAVEMPATTLDIQHGSPGVFCDDGTFIRQNSCSSSDYASSDTIPKKPRGSNAFEQKQSLSGYVLHENGVEQIGISEAVIRPADASGIELVSSDMTLETNEERTQEASDSASNSGFREITNKTTSSYVKLTSEGSMNEVSGCTLHSGNMEPNGQPQIVTMHGLINDGYVSDVDLNNSSRSMHIEKASALLKASNVSLTEDIGNIDNPSSNLEDTNSKSNCNDYQIVAIKRLHNVETEKVRCVDDRPLISENRDQILQVVKLEEPSDQPDRDQHEIIKNCVINTGIDNYETNDVIGNEEMLPESSAEPQISVAQAQHAGTTAVVGFSSEQVTCKPSVSGTRVPDYVQSTLKEETGYITLEKYKTLNPGQKENCVINTCTNNNETNDVMGNDNGVPSKAQCQAGIEEMLPEGSAEPQISVAQAQNAGTTAAVGFNSEPVTCKPSVSGTSVPYYVQSTLKEEAGYITLEKYKTLNPGTF